MMEPLRPALAKRLERARDLTRAAAIVMAAAIHALLTTGKVKK